MDQLAARGIGIEVAYAEPDRQIVLALQVAVGTTVREAVAEAMLEESLQAMAPDVAALGVWGERVSGDRIVAAGDRIELYRALLMDPRAARMQRAARGETMGRDGANAS